MLFLLFICLLSDSFSCRAPATKPKRVKKMVFFLPYRGHLGESMKMEGDSQELWVKMGEWSWLLCCKRLLQVWTLKEEPWSISQDPSPHGPQPQPPPQGRGQTPTAPHSTLVRRQENLQMSRGRIPQECILIFKTTQ